MVIPSACSFADDDNFGYWLDVKARQMSESVRKLGKQILITTLVGEVSRRRPRLLLGAQQGALIVLIWPASHWLWKQLCGDEFLLRWNSLKPGIHGSRCKANRQSMGCAPTVRSCVRLFPRLLNRSESCDQRCLWRPCKSRSSEPLPFWNGLSEMLGIRPSSGCG